MARQSLIALLFYFTSTVLFAQERNYKLPVGVNAEDYSQEYVVVRLKEGIPAKSQTGRTSNPLGDFESQKYLSYLESSRPSNNSRLSSHPLNNLYKIKLNEGQDPLEVIKQLLENDAVLYAEPYFNHRPLFIPDDPEAQPGEAQWYLTNINAYDAWTIEKGDSSIVIGVLDTGILPEHFDIHDNIAINYDDPINGVDDDADGLVDNYSGWDIANNDNNPISDTNLHGHGVAGVSSASTNNGLGIAGVGFRSKFLPIKIFRSGSDSFSNGYEAIALAADLGCQVINLSWGSANTFTQAGQDIINYAVEVRDAVVVAAAGNTNAELDFYPASYENVLSVGASNVSDVKADFATYSYKIDLMAPGKAIYVSDGEEAFSIKQGSSYSAPMVAGAAALVRNRFPNLTAKQVMEKIRVTVDDIYEIPGNSAYQGQLGKGRLNILKALTAFSPSLRITSFNYDNGIGKHAFYGDTLSISVDITNYLNATANAKATLSSPSPFVEVLDGTFDVGALGTMQSANNESQTFRVKLADNLPVDETINLRIDFSDGLYQDFQYISIQTDPEYLTVNNQTLQMTVGSSGTLGYNINNFGQGVGLLFNDMRLLNNIGFIAADRSDRVKDNLPTILSINLRDLDFGASENIKLFKNSTASYDARNVFEDVETINPMDLRIEQKTLAWEEPGNLMILEYRLTNTGTEVLEDLHAGVFADWDLNIKDFNQAGWDAGNLLGYVRDSQSDDLYAGLALLNAETPFYHAIDNKNANGNSADIPGFINDENKFDLVADGIAKTNAGVNGGGNDVSHVIGYTLSSLGVNESKKLAFTIVTGNSLADLQLAASNASAQYQNYLDNPAVLHIAETCPGEPAEIDPPGINFEFYDDVTLSNLLYTGEAYTTPIVTSTQTYYVVNKDEGYDGDVFRVLAKPKAPNADFEISSNPLLLDETGETEAQFTDKSPDATAWLWNFDNGFNASVQHPIMNFSTKGSYNIFLTVTNDIGCEETVMKTLEVDNRSNKPNIPKQEICKGEQVTLSATNATDLRFYSDDGLTDLIFSGTSFTTDPIYQDSVLYVISVDSLYQSNPQKVRIETSEIKAAYSYAIDTADLTDKNLLHFHNNSENEVLYVWYIDGELAGNSTDISYTYHPENSFNLKLLAEDINGCKDSVSTVFMPKASPEPALNDFEICEGDTISIAPENGQVFYFYNEANELLKKGSFLQLNSLTNNTTVFVTSIDSLKESPAREVFIDVSEIQADFNITPDSIDIADMDQIAITQNSAEADTYVWYLNDELVSEASAPTLDFTATGENSVTLEVTNALGCESRLSKWVKITNITGTPLIGEELNIYPNPVYEALHFESKTPADLQLINAQGVIVVSKAAVNEAKIPVSHLANGVYILDVTMKNGTTIRKKIIKGSR